LTKQVTHLDPHSANQLTHNIDRANIASASLDFADPILRPTRQIGQHSLRHSASASIKRNALPDTHFVASASNAINLPRAVTHIRDQPNATRFSRQRHGPERDLQFHVWVQEMRDGLAPGDR
jgi:hypothetical protein